MANLVKKSLSVAEGGSLVDFLPDPLAVQMINFVREVNIMRRLLTVFRQPTRTWSRPKKASGSSAYHIPDGVTATLSGMSGTKVTWEAKKLMDYVLVDMEAIEDSQPDVVEQVMADFGEAIGEAEEMAILQGNPTHLATAPTPDAATTTNWYVRDPRLMFEGIFTVAGSVDAADSVDALSGAFDVDHINQALYNLGKYGRNKQNVIALAPSEQAANIRANADFHDASKSGLALASYINGLGSAGEGAGLITNIYGVRVYEAPFAPEGQIAVFLRTSPQMGDRRLIKIKSDEVIESDQVKYVISERVSFNYLYRDALCLIENLSTTLVS